MSRLSRRRRMPQAERPRALTRNNPRPPLMPTVNTNEGPGGNPARVTPREGPVSGRAGSLADHCLRGRGSRGRGRPAGDLRRTDRMDLQGWQHTLLGYMRMLGGDHGSHALHCSTLPIRTRGFRISSPVQHGSWGADWVVVDAQIR